MFEGSTPSNEALSISLIQPGKNIEPFTTFHPKFTYPIFGDEETVFGYQGLEIDLSFSNLDLTSNVTVTFDHKFKTIGETEATDIEALLKDFLPNGGLFTK
jgi:histone acetyltransferase 1